MTSKYKVIRNEAYDFLGESYATLYPNIHKYPATMLPQIGIQILNELGISSGRLLDPYCGSGSSFASALDCGLNDMQGFDINPLAVLISKARFTKVSVQSLMEEREVLNEKIVKFMRSNDPSPILTVPQITNVLFWFSEEVIQKLNILKYFLDEIKDEKIHRFFLIPFSETVRDCSYTRKSEFKLFRMKEKDLINFKPDVFSVFLKKLKDSIVIYNEYYYKKLRDDLNITVEYTKFSVKDSYFDVVLTSPPYGDSRTTVAYGQFSTLSNEWLGIEYARKVDKLLMGGIKSKEIIQHGLMADFIRKIDIIDPKRALEVSAFYEDLEHSIFKVAKSVKVGGKIIYVVGNRTVKNIQLPTDQFIAEKFENKGFRHLLTYKRALSNKSMPSKNSPSNVTGKKVSTMLWEYVVVCEKVLHFENDLNNRKKAGVAGGA